MILRCFKILTFLCNYKSDLRRNNQYFSRYIRLLSNVLEWQKSQERNGITNQDVRVKTEPQSQLPALNHHTTATTIYQAKAAIACLKQEGYSRISLPNSRHLQYSNSNSASCDKNRNNLSITTSNVIGAKNQTTSVLSPSSNSSSHFLISHHSHSLTNGIVSPSRIVNGKLSPTRTGSINVQTNQQYVSSSSSVSSNSVSNGCTIPKRMKTEAREEDEVVSQSRDCNRTSTAQIIPTRKRLKITFNKDTGRT